MDFMSTVTAFIGSMVHTRPTYQVQKPIPVTGIWFGTIRHKKKKCATTWTGTFTYNPLTHGIQINYNGKTYSPSGFAIAHYVAEQPYRSAAANGWVECEVFIGNQWRTVNYLRQISPPKPDTRKTNPKPIVETNVDVEKELAKASTTEPRRTPLVEYDSESDEEDFEIVQNPTPDSSTNTHNAPEPVAEYESDDEEMEVIQITINGNDYFLNENTCDIYDPETQEVVGKSQDGNHNLF